MRSGDIEEVTQEARQLQSDFADLKVEIIDSSSGIDVVNLKVRICDLLLCRGYITQTVQEYSDALQRLTTPDGVLNFLTTRKFLGYLNYELIKLFPKAVKNDENRIRLLNSAIEKYEKKSIKTSFHLILILLLKCSKKTIRLLQILPLAYLSLKSILKVHGKTEAFMFGKISLIRSFLIDGHLT